MNVKKIIPGPCDRYFRTSRSKPLIRSNRNKATCYRTQAARILLQVLTGSNDTGSAATVPPNLRVVSKELKGNFAFSSYRLANPYLGRVPDSGNVDINYNSVSNVFGQDQDTDPPSFLDWKLGGLRNKANEKSQKMFQVQSFRFGERIPLHTWSQRDSAGKPLGVIDYETVGLNRGKVSLSENSPTLISTLILRKTAGTLFLVLTVRPVE